MRPDASHQHRQRQVVAPLAPAWRHRRGPTQSSPRALLHRTTAGSQPLDLLAESLTCTHGTLKRLSLHISGKKSSLDFLAPRKKGYTCCNRKCRGPGLTNSVYAFLIHRLLLIMLGRFHSGTFLARLLLFSRRRAASYAAGHREQEHGKHYRRHYRHGTSLIMSILGAPK